MLRTPSAAGSISARRLRKRCAPSTPLVVGAAALVLGAVVFVGRGGEDFAYDVAKKGRNPAPYGRLSGRPIVPNPEAEKFPAGVARDEDGFPLITLRELKGGEGFQGLIHTSIPQSDGVLVQDVANTFRSGHHLGPTPSKALRALDTAVFGAAALVLGAVVFVGRGGEDFAYDVAKKGRNPAPYGRLSGRPIVPNPEAEKFPAGVPRDEDGFPLITLREQFDVNLTMYLEGIGPFTGEPTDFSGDWDFIPLDPEDEGFDPEDPMPRKPTEPPDELLSLQDPKSISIMKATPDEPIPEGKNAGKPPKRKVAMAAGSAPAPAAKASPAAKAAAPAP
eukprot:CAMPEP_0183485740 /NCGR_PEP_ID=MMETSP0370-20130417/179582_1 /TAXON_ID=268820 /ORGANISM="Peridinium aciculiferum, Strain PAER-2" /LENGTH=333 /DNA_ID=CAMNT_0025679047 /DNA_START=84 /DNA_END=1083 /DNA_ORIENTATION=-